MLIGQWRSTNTEMPNLASWIHSTVEEDFQRCFALCADLEVKNARLVEAIRWDQIGGLLLTGGTDISAEFHVDPLVDVSQIRRPDGVRDRWEFEAFKEARDRRLPILAICRGMQVMNLALGGSLQLDITGHDDQGMRSWECQPLIYEPGVEHQFEKVNSSHHQAIDRLAEGLVVEAQHAEDGVIEQVRMIDYSWGLGVQYHPERGEIYAPLFQDFFFQVQRGGGGGSR